MSKLVDKIRTKYLEATHGFNDGWVCKGLIEELIEIQKYLNNLNLEKELDKYER